MAQLGIPVAFISSGYVAVDREGVLEVPAVRMTARHKTRAASTDRGRRVLASIADPTPYKAWLRPMSGSTQTMSEHIAVGAQTQCEN